MADQLCRHCKRPISDHYSTSACRISPTFFDPAPPEAKRCTCVWIRGRLDFPSHEKCPEHGAKRGAPAAHCCCEEDADGSIPSYAPDCPIHGADRPEPCKGCRGLTEHARDCPELGAKRKPEPEAGQELPILRDWGDSFDVLEHSRIYRTAGGVLRRRAVQADLLALIPKLTPEQQDALWEIQCGAAGRNRLRAAESERDTANARAEEAEEKLAEFLRCAHACDEVEESLKAATERAEKAEKRADKLDAECASLCEITGRLETEICRHRQERIGIAPSLAEQLALLRPVVDAARAWRKADIDPQTKPGGGLPPPPSEEPKAEVMAECYHCGAKLGTTKLCIYCEAERRNARIAELEKQLAHSPTHMLDRVAAQVVAVHVDIAESDKLRARVVALEAELADLRGRVEHEIHSHGDTLPRWCRRMTAALEGIVSIISAAALERLEPGEKP